MQITPSRCQCQSGRGKESDGFLSLGLRGEGIDDLDSEKGGKNISPLALLDGKGPKNMHWFAISLFAMRSYWRWLLQALKNPGGLLVAFYGLFSERLRVYGRFWRPRVYPEWNRRDGAGRGAVNQYQRLIAED